MKLKKMKTKEQVQKLPLSYNQKKMWDYCERKWMHRYIFSRPDSFSKALWFGGNVHRLLERYFRKKEKSKPLKWESFEKEKLGKQLVQDVIKMVESDIDTILAVEERVELSGVRCVVDLVYLDKDWNEVVLDWKTSLCSYKMKDTENDEQLLLYAFMLNCIGDYHPTWVAHGVMNKSNGNVQYNKCTFDYYYAEYIFDQFLRTIKDIDSKVVKFYDEGEDTFIKKETRNECYEYGQLCPYVSHCFAPRNYFNVVSESDDLF